MECNICLDPFDATEHRPKFLPCGHTYCVKCLHRLADKKCPVDGKVFLRDAAELPDNFIVLQNLKVPLPQRFWCISCEKEATAVCVEDHPVRSLRKARTQEAASRMEALQQAKAALVEVRDAVETAYQGLREALQREEQMLIARQSLLEVALGADADTWEQAKKDAELDGLPLAVWRLSTALADPTAACEVTLRRGASGDAAWRCEVRPADDAASRLLLCVLAASGQLQEQVQDQLAGQGAVPEAPGWEEASNRNNPFGRNSPVGCKVKTSDGLVGTVSKIVSEYDGNYWGYKVEVKIDRSAQLLHCPCDELTPVLEPWGLICEATPSALDILATSCSEEIKVKADLLASDGLKEVLTLTGLKCSVATSFCQQVLQQVAPRLERLQLVSPQQQHVDQALAMPRLHSLAVVDVKKEWLQKVAAKESLRFLELHGTFYDSLAEPLPVFSRPVPPAGLRWLRCGFYPLRAALALARAHAATLEELQLVADGVSPCYGSPYGCPNLALVVQQCDLARLKRLVLLRENAYGYLCAHSPGSCKSQKLALWDMFVGCGASVEVICSCCDRSCMP